MEKQTAKDLKNAYQREWRRKNKEKVQGYSERYWAKKLAEKQAAAETSK